METFFMKKYTKSDINSLSDVFAAWMGGYPENDAETKTFLQKKELDTAFSVIDINGILNEEIFIPEEILTAVYSVIPLKLPVKEKEVTVFPQEFNKLNHRVLHSDGIVRSLNMSFKSAYNLKQKYYETKDKAIKREKSRIINIKYRERHAKAIAERVKQRRLNAKQMDLEGLKAADKANNSRPKRKEACKKYYQTHKEEITAKAKANPKVIEYKRKYKAKMRFQKTTGKTVLALLNGIINRNQGI